MVRTRINVDVPTTLVIATKFNSKPSYPSSLNIFTTISHGIKIFANSARNMLI